MPIREEHFPGELEPEGGSLRSFLTLLFKHQLKILTVLYACIVTAAVASFLIPPTYEAKSAILVKFGREYIYRPVVGSMTQISVSPSNQEEIINSEIRILTSRELIGQVVKAIGVAELYPRLIKSYPRGITPTDMAILEFQKRLSVDVVKKSNVIEVSYQHKDPQLAAKAVNLLVDSFREKHLQVYSDDKSSFLEQQVEDYRMKLEGSEEGLQQFKQENRVYALEEQRNLLLKQRIDLDTLQKETQSRISELKEKLAALIPQQKGILETGRLYTSSERDRIITDAKAKLLDLQIKEQDLLVKYKEKSQLVINIRKEIEMAKEFARQQEDDQGKVVRTGNPVFQELEKERIKAEADLKGQEVKGMTIRRQIDQLEAEIGKLDLSERKFVDLRRNFTINEKNYQIYLDKYEDARISDDMNRRKLANIGTIHQATPPIKPIKPRKGLNLILALVLGSVGGLCVAFLSEYLGQGLTTPEIAEKRLQVSVLASVPLSDRL